jgi:hypothetical protein
MIICIFAYVCCFAIYSYFEYNQRENAVKLVTKIVMSFIGTLTASFPDIVEINVYWISTAKAEGKNVMGVQTDIGADLKRVKVVILQDANTAIAARFAHEAPRDERSLPVARDPPGHRGGPPDHRLHRRRRQGARGERPWDRPPLRKRAVFHTFM